jgi:small-conductance mechanosensitive channel
MESPEPAMRIQNLADSSVVIVFYAWVDQTEADFGKVRSEAIRLVKTALDEAGVSMPEPIYNVRMSMEKADVESPLSTRQESRPVLEQARRAEVAVDDDIDKQIREDLAREGDQNLLAE